MLVLLYLYINSLINLPSIKLTEKNVAEHIKFYHDYNLLDKVDFFSKSLLGKEYANDPLGEGQESKIDADPIFRFDKFDCMTYVESVLALALATDESEVETSKIKISYKNAELDYVNRHHFFETDWVRHNANLVLDITANIGVKVEYVRGVINKQNWFLKNKNIEVGGEPINVRLAYIPAKTSLNEIANKLPKVSIVGIVTNDAQMKAKIGSDIFISHVGFLIKKNNKIIMRHASLDAKKVVDVDFADYLKNMQKNATKVGFKLWQIDKLESDKVGDHLPLVVDKFATEEKKVALTLDLCGGKHGSGFDLNLANFLTQNKITSTLFVSGEWINKNPALFEALTNNPNFDIQNHGFNHKPAFTRERKIYEIAGTNSIFELTREIQRNIDLEVAKGENFPNLYRAGTAFYDELAVRVIANMNLKVAGYAISLDEGAKLTKNQVAANMLKAQAGDILLAHLNHPESGTREGIMASALKLKNMGFSFVFLKDEID
jgi:peptidoglycan/xylan/chitin deacetylase (PgdA/CDA1 family)